jgi:hypothetical protein
MNYKRHDRAADLVHRFRFVNDVPLNASNADVRVNFIEYWEMGAHKLQHFSWITDLRVSKRNVFHLMRGAAIPAYDPRALYDHGSGELSQRFDYRFPSFGGTFALRQEWLSLLKTISWHSGVPRE